MARRSSTRVYTYLHTRQLLLGAGGAEAGSPTNCAAGCQSARVWRPVEKRDVGMATTLPSLSVAVTVQ